MAKIKYKIDLTERRRKEIRYLHNKINKT